MNQSYFLKNLPTPLQFWVRPMLLMSLGLHGLLLAAPMPPHQKPKPTAKEPEKVKITQLPTTSSSPTPNTAPKIALKPSPVVPKAAPSLVARQPIRSQPAPIRQPSSVIPPITPQTRTIPRPQPTPAPSVSPPAASPTPTPSASASPTPSPTPSQESTVQSSFADFPFPEGTQPGSLGLLSGETDQAAHNTQQGLIDVVTFYNTKLPEKKFTSKIITDDPELKIYQVATNTGEPQFLHLVSKEGKTVIFLAPQQVTDLKKLLDAGTRSPEEVAFYEIMKQLENDEQLALATVEANDTATLPEPDKFADRNKFELRSKTVPFKPISPQELFGILESQLSQKGFKQIFKEASYGGTQGLTYKVTQGSFQRYIYLIPNSENRTFLILSKDSPF